MKNFSLIFISVLLQAFVHSPLVNGQPAETNFDESKVGEYVLPDPLMSDNGQRVTTVNQWETQQRPSILAKFSRYVYGRLPGRPSDMHFKINSVDPGALGGKATRKQITIFFARGSDEPALQVLLYLPNQAKAVPVFVGLNYYGNHSVHSDPGITLSTRWMNNNQELKVVDHRATEGSRGAQKSRWPVEELIMHGYGLATAYYGDLEPDHKDGYKDGIRTTLQDILKIDKEEWGALGAWAWGLSRMMDYLETDKQVDNKKVFLTGHSRLGKAALWAGANDRRFAMMISNDSGEGGTSLSRRNYGETVEKINTAFPYWFSPNYKNYNENVDQLPVDQHMLLALMAPRPLYVASAAEDQWADPKGEFLSAKHAGEVYKLYNKKGLGVEEMPAVNDPAGETIRYHIRSGKHDITLYDWQQYISFADKHFK